MDETIHVGDFLFAELNITVIRIKKGAILRIAPKSFIFIRKYIISYLLIQLFLYNAYSKQQQLQL